MKLDVSKINVDSHSSEDLTALIFIEGMTDKEKRKFQATHNASVHEGFRSEGWINEWKKHDTNFTYQSAHDHLVNAEAEI